MESKYILLITFTVIVVAVGIGSTLNMTLMPVGEPKDVLVAYVDTIPKTDYQSRDYFYSELSLLFNDEGMCDLIVDDSSKSVCQFPFRILRDDVNACDSLFNEDFLASCNVLYSYHFDDFGSEELAVKRDYELKTNSSKIFVSNKDFYFEIELDTYLKSMRKETALCLLEEPSENHKDCVYDLIQPLQEYYEAKFTLSIMP